MSINTNVAKNKTKTLTAAINTTLIAGEAEWWHQNGIQALPSCIPYTKKPDGALSNGKEILLKGWPTLKMDLEHTRNLFNTPTNISIVLDDNNLVALDLENALIGVIAKTLAPATWLFIREGAPTKLLFRCMDIPDKRTTKMYKLHKGLGGELILEVLSKGALVVPPSIHSTGHLLEWGAIAPTKVPPVSLPYEELIKLANQIVAIYMLVRIWDEGLPRHDTIGALTGALLHSGYSVKQTKHIIGTLLELVDGEELKDRKRYVTDTINAFENKEPYSGLPRLIELIDDKTFSDKLTLLLDLGNVNMGITGIKKAPSKKAALKAKTAAKAKAKIKPAKAVSSNTPPITPPAPTTATNEPPASLRAKTQPTVTTPTTDVNKFTVGEYTVELETVADVVMQPIEWLWEGRLAKRKIMLLAGPAGKGKSTIALDIAARISAGSTWPDGTPCVQGSTLLLSAEEDAADTIKPRLIAAEGCCEFIFRPKAIKLQQGNSSQDTMLSLDNIPVLDQMLTNHPSITLLIIDPVASYLGSSVDHNSDPSVRTVLNGIQFLAEKHNIAVLLLMHLNKGNGQDALLRVGGSVAWGAVPRSVFLVAEDFALPKHRYMLNAKNNAYGGTTGLGYTMSTVVVDSARQIQAGRVIWEPELLNMTAQEYTDSVPTKRNAQNKTELAKDIIREHMAKGIVAKEAIDEALQVAGVKDTTMKLARKALGVHIKKGGKGGTGPIYAPLTSGKVVPINASVTLDDEP